MNVMARYLGGNAFLMAPTVFGEVLQELQGVEDWDEQQEAREALAVNPEFAAFLSASIEAPALAARSELLGTAGAGGDGIWQLVRLGGGGAGPIAAAEAEKAKITAAYSIERVFSGSDEIVLFGGDSSRRAVLKVGAEAAVFVETSLLDIARERGASADYVGKAPARAVEATMELLEDLTGLYKAAEKKGGEDAKVEKLKMAIAAVLDQALTQDALLDGSPVERYTIKKAYHLAFYQAWHIAYPDKPVPEAFASHIPLLVAQADKGDRKISLEAAGQSTDYFSDLETMYEMSDVTEVVAALVAPLTRIADENRTSGLYTQGFDVMTWLKDIKRRPDAEYLRSSAISQPLILAAQLARYVYLYNRGMRFTREMVERDLLRLTGHSQGVLAATVISMFAGDDLLDPQLLKEYVAEALKAVQILAHQGLRMQRVVEKLYDATPSEIAAAGIDTTQEKPAPMGFITGLKHADLVKWVGGVNRKLEKDKQIYASLHNGPRRFIVSGPVSSLLALREAINDKIAKDKQDHPHKKTPVMDASFSFLSTSVPFHSPYMNGVPEAVEADVARNNLWLGTRNMPRAMVVETFEGKDLRKLAKSPAELTRRLLRGMSTQPVHYQAVTQALTGTTVIGIGPGEDHVLTVRANLNGTADTAYVAAGGVNGLKCLFTTKENELPKPLDYNRHRAEVVVLSGSKRTAINNPSTRLVHRPVIRGGGMTPTTGNEDIVVAATNYGYSIELAGGAQGSAEILERRIRAIVKGTDAREALNPGEYITVNLLYLSPYIWGFLPTVKKLIAEGLPIMGLTIAAGIPDADTMAKLLQEMNGINCWDISLKPGDDKGMEAVIEIAQKSPDRQIIVQVELGPAGGHHSWGTQEVLRKAYRKLRDCPNIVLGCGGGIANQEDAADMIEGTWNDEGVPMPFDFVLLGTRLMNADEAHTSAKVKERLRKARGAAMSDFTNMKASYNAKTDETSTIASDGERIHHSRTRAAVLLDWMREQLVRKPHPKGAAASADDVKKHEEGETARIARLISENRVGLINALNLTQKPYFVNTMSPLAGDGHPDYKDWQMTDMGFGEVLKRLVAMMYFPEDGEESGWIDFSWRDFLGRYMEYIESKYQRPDEKGKMPERFFKTVEVWDKTTNPPLKHFPELEKDPKAVIERFLTQYPKARTMRLDRRDLDEFTRLSNLATFKMKPLPFIYRLDETLWREFATDALWQSEYERFDADAVLPEPGPVAVAGIPDQDEGIASIYDTFDRAIQHRLLISQLGLTSERTDTVKATTAKPKARSYQLYQQALRDNPGKIVQVATIIANPDGESTFEVRVYELADTQRAGMRRVSFMGAPVLGSKAPQLKGIKTVLNETKRTEYNVTEEALARTAEKIGKEGPVSPYARLIYAIASSDQGNLSALLLANQIFQGKTPIINYLREAILPRDGQRWVVERDDDGKVTRIAIYHDKYLVESAGPKVELIPNTDASVQADFKVILRHADPRSEDLTNPRVVPMVYYFNYNGDKQGYAPIHEVMDGLSDRIKDFYASLTESDTDWRQLSVSSTFKSRFKLTQGEVRHMVGAFRRPDGHVVKYQDDDYEVELVINEVENSTAGKRVRCSGYVRRSDGRDGERPGIPINVWIKGVFNAFFETVFPPEMDVDLFRLLHLKSGLSETTQDGRWAIRVDQETFIRGNYAGEDVAYLRSETVTDEIELTDDAQIQAISARPWFALEGGAKLKEKDRLRFVLDVNVTENSDKTKTYRTGGQVYRVKTGRKSAKLELVGTVSYSYPAEGTDAGTREKTKKFLRNDPVQLYLKGRSVLPKPVEVKVAVDEIESAERRAPLDMLDYALASGDLNPIHRDPYIAGSAGLADVIVHGMWTKGEATAQAIELLGDGDPARLVGMEDVEFTDMVDLGEKFKIVYKHAFNLKGNSIYTFEVKRLEGVGSKRPNGSDKQEVIAKGRVVMKPERTLHMFTGQGSARLKMFEDFKDSKAAQALLERAEKYFKKAHKFSIKQVVETGGYKHGETLKLNVDGREPALKAPKGKTILDLTQFQQPALFIYELMALAAMEEAGRVSGDELKAGHSLGEYAAISSLGFLPFEAILEIVYQRGLTMQNILKSPEFNGTEYRLAVVNLRNYQKPVEGAMPGVTKPLTEADLRTIGEAVSTESGEFLQIANYNSKEKTYAVAATKAGIEALQNYMDENFVRTSGTESDPGVMELEGILVPFHSALLLSGVEKFRQTLMDSFPGRILKPGTDGEPYDIATMTADEIAGLQDLSEDEFDAAKLTQRYIPNLVAKPFSLKRDYIQMVYDYTVEISRKNAKYIKDADYSSKILKHVLENFQVWALRPNTLARILVIELLAYQFASPVRWIETLDVVMNGIPGFEAARMLFEMGPAGYLCAMAGSQLGTNAKRGEVTSIVAPKIYGIANAKHREQMLSGVFISDRPNGNSTATKPTETVAKPVAPATTVAPAPATAPAPQTAAPVTQPATAAAPVAAGDRPAIVTGAKTAPAERPTMDVETAALAIIAINLGVPIADIKAKMGETIDALSNGNSTKGNNVVIKLGVEFELSADDLPNAKTTPLSQLVPLLAGLVKGYKNPGAAMRDAFDSFAVKALRAKGLDRKAIDTYLLDTRMLSEKRAFDLVNYITALAAGGYFDAHTLEQAVDDYAVTFNVAIPDKTLLVSAGDGSNGGPTISAEALEAFQKKFFGIINDTFLRALELAGIPWQKWFVKEDRARIKELEEAAKIYQLEHVMRYAKATQPMFTPEQVVDLSDDRGPTLINDFISDLRAGKVKAEDLAVRKAQILRWASESLIAVLAARFDWAKRTRVLDNRDQIQTELKDLIKQARAIVGDPAKRGYKPWDKLKAPKTTIEKDGTVKFDKKDRLVDRKKSETFVDFAREEKRSARMRNPQDGKVHPYASMRDLPVEKNGSEIKPEQTRILLAAMEEFAKNGFDFTRAVLDENGEPLIGEDGKPVRLPQTVWISGAGPAGMAEALAEFFVPGGATVVISHFDPKKPTPYDDLDRYQKLRDQYGPGRVILAPMNQASQADIKAVARYIADKHDLVADLVIPFGAIPPRNTLGSDNQGTTAFIEDLMMNSYEWMMAAVAEIIAERSLDKKVLGAPPLSPNHGVFGMDVPYGETKRGAEAIFHYIKSDPLGKHMKVAGARIGWVNTPLMKDLAEIAEILESDYGVRTYFPREMAFKLTTLYKLSMMSPEERAAMGWEAWEETCFADFNGAFEVLENYKSDRPENTRTGVAALVEDLKLAMKNRSEAQKAIYAIEQAERALRGEDTDADIKAKAEARLGDVKADLEGYIRKQQPPRPSEQQVEGLRQQYGYKDGKLDLAKTFVIVGKGEVSPFANSRIRWEYETRGELSLESCIILAKIMGKIEYRQSKDHNGWWDLAEDKAITDWEVKKKYHDEMLANSGVRYVDPTVAGFDPRNILTWVDEPVGAGGADVECTSEEDADAKVKAYLSADDSGTPSPFKESDVFKFEHEGVWKVHLPAGAIRKVKKSLAIERWVAGQIPKGWSAERLGIPKILTDKVDRTALFNMVATIDALYDAGITDFAEIVGILGLSQVGNVQGGGMGGMNSMTDLQKGYKLGQKVEDDVLENTLINVQKDIVTRWILRVAGETNSPVTACATSASSLQMGLDMLRLGRARVVFVGGFDDYGEEGAIGFSTMNATAATAAMNKKGLGARQHPRANSASRGGFIEAHGAGTMWLMSAADAIALGLPMYGIVGEVISASDGFSESAPEPGQGLLAKDKIALIVAALKTLGLAGKDIAVIYQHGTSTKANDLNEAKLYSHVLKLLKKKFGDLAVMRAQKNITGHGKGLAAVLQLIGMLQTLNTGTIAGDRNLDAVDPEFASEGLLGNLLYTNHTVDFGPFSLMAGLATSLGFGHEGVMALLVNPVLVLMSMTEEQRKTYYAKLDERLQVIVQAEIDYLMGRRGLYDFAKGYLFEGKDKEAKKRAQEECLRDRDAFVFDPIKAVFVRRDEAQRRVARSERKAAAAKVPTPQLRIVPSVLPRGHDRLERYYPGPDAVDLSMIDITATAVRAPEAGGATMVGAAP